MRCLYHPPQGSEQVEKEGEGKNVRSKCCEMPSFRHVVIIALMNSMHVWLVAYTRSV